MEPVNLSVKILQEIRDGQSRVEERVSANQEQTNQCVEFR